MRYWCCSRSIFSIWVPPFHRLLSGDLTQFIQRPLFLEFWLVSGGFSSVYLIRNGSPNSWRIAATRHRLSVRDMSAIERRPPYLYECLWFHYLAVCGSWRPVTNRHSFWWPVTDRVYSTCMLSTTASVNQSLSLRSLAVFLTIWGRWEAAIRSAKAVKSLGEASPLVFAASSLFVFAFKLLKPLSYAGYQSLNQ